MAIEQNVSLSTIVSYSFTLELGRKRQVENEQPVAFYGKLVGLVTVGQDEIIKFNDVVTDYGEPYDNSSGLFIAPVAGLYVFSTTIMVEQNFDTHVGIYINNHLTTNIKLHGAEHEYDTMSQTVIYYLRVRDTVSIRHYDGTKSIHGDYTTFMGFLLYEDFGDLSGTSSVNTIIG